jgi:hypothetical protein
MLSVRQFLASFVRIVVAGLAVGCKRGTPVKKLWLHDAGATRPRRFDDVKVMKKGAAYVKFQTASGEVIEFSRQYEIKQ